jgi:hypothetical protein
MSTGAPAKASQQVFVCYRREETAAHAGRVYDAMVSRYGERNVFMDVDMEPGVDFVERITEVVSGCVALIVVMGPGWGTVEDEDGTRRIDDPDDFVRLEVEIGLRNGVHVIPALVHGARMPRREDLPPELQPLARRNALELSDGRWAYDVGRLLTALDERVTDETELQAGTRPEPTESELNPQPLPPGPVPPWRWVLEGALVAGLTSFAVRAAAWQIPVHSDKQEPASSSETAAQIAGIVGRQASTGAIAGLAVALWLAYRLNRSGGLPWLRGLLVGALAGALGGLILGLLTFLPSENLGPDERNEVALLAVPVTGAVFGSLIGSLWRPSRIGLAALGGAVGGLLFQLFSNGVGLNNKDTLPVDLNFGLAAATIAGLALVALVAYERRSPSGTPRAADTA